MSTVRFSYYELLERLHAVILQELEELEDAHKHRPVPAVAWVARNLLELGVWSGYCAISEKHADRFAKDAARDAVHMLDLPVEVARDLVPASTHRGPEREPRSVSKDSDW